MGVNSLARPKKKTKKFKTNLKFELYGITILTLSIIALSQPDTDVVRSLTFMFRLILGNFDFVIPLVCIYIGLYAMMKREWPVWLTSRKIGVLLIVLALALMGHISLFSLRLPNGDYTAGQIMSLTWTGHMDSLKPNANGQAALTPKLGGGMIGASLYALFYLLFANLGARLIQYTLFIAGFSLLTGWTIGDVIGLVKRRTPFKQTLLGRYIRQQWKELRKPARKVQEKPSPRKAVLPAADMSDDYDEETLPPVRNVRKGSKPRSLFFELLKPDTQRRGQKKSVPDQSTENAVSASAYEEEVTVFKADEHEQENWHSSEEEGHDSMLSIPVIRDFQEQVLQEKTANSLPAAHVTENELAAHGDAVDADAEADPSQFVMNNKPLQKPYEIPSLSLLSQPIGGKGADSLDYKAVARKLESTLESFGVKAKVLEVVRGPSVTRYEIQPDVGVKVSRIVNLTDDIALALAAKDIRMEAPIPGKSAIGIEVPNSEVSIVTMREVMETAAFQDSSSKLSITLGRDIGGQPIVGNLARMPHLLVAGATGSGKSVCINGIITSILYKATPEEVKFLMVDPKMVELNVYNGIPHLLAPVVTDPRRASLALKKVVVEMEKRYELFSKSGTRNIEGYNAMLKETQTGAPLPYIVVIVDELADLMMVAAGDVEDAICRLAQMARAAGIHLIIATQRPSVDVITGVIKANIPSRIAFGVSSQVDSRTILDMVGAEKLLGRGDMLYLPMGASKPMRVQGAFLSDQEVEAVVSFVRGQGQAEYVEDMVPQVEDQAEAKDEFEDELYDQAVQIILESKQASVSLLQRRMRVGYTRAARLIDSMEARGIVGPYEGSKPREVLVTLEQYQMGNPNKLSS